MQHIQDNEFDQLFKDTFEEAEIAPSVNLWDQIETQLAVKPRRVFPVYWMAAALAAVAISAGLLLYPGRYYSKGGTEKNLPGGIVKATAPISNTKVSIDPSYKATAVARSSVTSAGSAGFKPAAVATGIEFATQRDDPKKDLKDVQPLGLNTHLYSKQIVVTQEKIALPKSSGPTAAEAIILASNDSRTTGNIDRAAGHTGRSENGDEVINENDTRTESKGIRNMGDLINYVVDKVDKSDEKVIQFKTDDDNSSLIALNIGIIRFNQKKHK